MQYRNDKFRLRVVCAVALLLTQTPASVRAQSDAPSRALAVQLFDEAEALAQQAKTSEACPKYAESYRLDPQLGVLIYLAECYEKNGQLASAWGGYRQAEEIALKRGDARAENARERALALAPRLSYVTVRVPEPRVPGLEISRDGQAIAPVLWGSRAAIDPGTHHFEARAPGYKTWHQELVVAEGAGSGTIDVPKLTAEAGASGPTGAANVGSSSAASNRGSSQRIAAIAVGGLGLAGIGVGGFLGLSAQATLSDAKRLCNDDDFCTPRGAELRDSAQSKALVATIATGVGVAALVGAGVLWFTAPRADRVARSSGSKRASAWSVTPTSQGWGIEMSHAF